MPAPYADFGDVADAYAPEGSSDIWVDTIRTAAANLVQSVAPTPAGEPDGYIAAAKASEILVGHYLWNNRGTYSSLSGEAGSISFIGKNDLLEIIGGVMPAEWTLDGDPLFGDASTVYISKGAP